MPIGARQDQWLNTLHLDGEDLGIWDSFAGGDVQATETKYRPGGMRPEITLGGSVSVNNITLGRLFEAGAHLGTLRKLMTAKVGTAQATVARQALDEDGNPYGDPLVYHGKLLQVMPGDNDSTSQSAQIWSVVISTAGSVA